MTASAKAAGPVVKAGAAAAAAFRQSRASSRVLERNLLAQGMKKGAGFHTHHMVAGADARALKARQILDKFGIDINSAENGIFLPGSDAMKNGYKGKLPLHPRIHTKEYHEWVYEQLKRAKSGDEARELLKTIREGIESGKEPWKQATDGACQAK